MKRLAGRTVFTVGARSYEWDDVVLAAHVWGDYAALESRIRKAVACRKRLEDTDEEFPEDEVDDASDQWRYERDLISADDAQAWLAARDLDTDEWLEYVTGSVMRTKWAADLDDITRTYDVPDDEVDAVMYGEAVCSGTLTELAERLAGTAAVYDRAVDENERATRCTKAELRTGLKGLPRGIRQAGIFGLSPKATLERAEFLACVTLSFDRFVDRIAAPGAVEREIETHALDWTRLECDSVSFDAEETAREAVLLVREDGLPLTEAASMAKAPVLKTLYVLEDTQPVLKDRLVAALPGDLVGPLAVDGGFLLVSVAKRVEPSINDRSMRTRARDRVVQRTINSEVTKRVQWHERV